MCGVDTRLLEVLCFWFFTKNEVFFFPFAPELCKSLNPTEELLLELDGGAGQKKPPRKERKKSLISYASILFLFQIS